MVVRLLNCLGNGDTAGMIRFGRHTQSFLILFCIALIAMRVGGAHLHYCFDGAEPPVTLHVDGHEGAHHEEGAEHADLDVSVSHDVLIKKASLPFEQLFWLAAFAVLFLLSPQLRGQIFSVLHSHPVEAHRAHLRPPLRGPPV